MGQHRAITLAMTGASGAPYALTLLKALCEHYDQVFLMISSAARVVLATESEIALPENTKQAKTKLVELLGVPAAKLELFSGNNWMAPVASGSSAPKQMVVCPCSTGSLSAIACGASDNLIERAADVVLKERGQLILVPRETPYSTVHLENMFKLSQMGAVILPASPGFYHQPKSIDDLVNFVVGRVLDHLQVPQVMAPRWGYGSNP